MKIEQLKDVIANADLDVDIIRRDYEGVSTAITCDLLDMGWSNFTYGDIVKAVDELNSDPYFVRLAQTVGL